MLPVILPDMLCYAMPCYAMLCYATSNTTRHARKVLPGAAMLSGMLPGKLPGRCCYAVRYGATLPNVPLHVLVIIVINNNDTNNKPTHMGITPDDNCDCNCNCKRTCNCNCDLTVPVTLRLALTPSTLRCGNQYLS